MPSMNDDLQWALSQGMPVPPAQASTNDYIPEEPGETIYAPSMNGHAVMDEAPWGPMKPIPPAIQVPELIPEMVPEIFRGWLTDISGHACFPLEMVAGPAIVAASIIIGRKIGIRPWRFSDYTVVPNLWGAIIARPATMKSNAIQEAIKPLKRLGITARDRYESEKATFEADVEWAKSEVDALKSEMKVAARGKSAKSPEMLKDELAMKLQEIERLAIKQRRYWVGDATQEKLADMLKDNPNGLLVYYDELAGWIGEMDRPGREGSRPFYLTAWDGKDDYQVDRIARGENYIPAVCLAVIGGIQPDRLKRYIEEAISGGKGGDGMIQRFQMLIYIDHLQEWKAPDHWPDTQAKNEAFEAFQWLDETNLGSMANDDQDIPYLEFSPEAQVIADQWRQELEDRVRGPAHAGMPAFEAHLGKYRSLMPSLALIFHLLDCYLHLPKLVETLPAISVKALTLAADWCDYLEGHARRVYQAELAPGGDATISLADKFQNGQIPNGTTVRDICLHHWAGLDTTDKVDQALKALESVGWIRMETRQNSTGRPSRQVQIHPDLRGATNG